MCKTPRALHYCFLAFGDRDRVISARTAACRHWPQLHAPNCKRVGLTRLCPHVHGTYGTHGILVRGIFLKQLETRAYFCSIAPRAFAALRRAVGLRSSSTVTTAASQSTPGATLHRSHADPLSPDSPIHITPESDQRQAKSARCSVRRR